MSEKYKITWHLEWYIINDDRLFGEITLGISTEKVREILGIDKSDPMVGIFPIDKDSSIRLSEETGVQFDLKSYDYFIGGYTD